MPATKTPPAARPTDRAAARWAGVIADPSRLALLRAVAAGPTAVTALADAVALPVVNVSHHLGVLRAAGVVAAAKAGRFVRYSLAGGNIADNDTIALRGPGGVVVLVPR